MSISLAQGLGITRMSPASNAYAAALAGFAPPTGRALVLAARANAMLRNVPCVSVTCYGSAPRRTPTTKGPSFSALTHHERRNKPGSMAESLHSAMHLRSHFAEVASRFGDVAAVAREGR